MHWVAIIFSVAIALLATFSWIANIYGFGFSNLLCAEGLRWFINGLSEHLSHVPYTPIICMTICLSWLKESGITNIHHHHNSLKERRAIEFAVVALIICLCTITATAIVPPPLLLSAFGTWNGSALQHSWPYLLMGIISIVTIVYGYTSGRFASISEIFKHGTKLPALIATLFPTLLVASILHAVILYIFQLSEDFWWLETILYYLPTAIFILQKR